MFHSKKNLIFWICFTAVTILYFLVKFYSPHHISQLFHAQELNTLNKLTQNTSLQPLGFYTGEIEERFLGPISSVLSGILLIAFSMVYLRSSSMKQYGLAIFIFLLLTKFEILFYPPYGDPISGPWTEAIWLIRNNFNYLGLLQETEAAIGGPKVYFFTLYPTFLAILLKILPTKLFLLVNHIIVFALVAILITLLRDILLKITSQSIAILSSLLLLFLPLFQSMTEMLNMEMPCLFFAVCSSYYCIHKNMPKATLMAILSALMKGPGIIACAAVFIISIILFLTDHSATQKNRFNQLFWGIGAILFAALKIFLRSHFVNTSPDQINATGLFISWEVIQNNTMFKLYAASLLGAGLLYIKEKFVIKTEEKHSFITKHYVLLVMLLFSGLWFGLYSNFGGLNPRYTLFVIPFLICGIILVAVSFIRIKNIIFIALLNGTLLAAFGSYGFFHPPVGNIEYAYNYLERSLEYRNDLKAYMKAADIIQKHFAHFTIGAPVIRAQALAFHEMGYVDNPLKIILYGAHITHSGITDFKGLKTLNLKKTLWVGFQSQRYPDYPVDPQDKIVKEIVFGKRRIPLFMGGIAIEKMRNLVLLRYSAIRQRKQNP